MDLNRWITIWWLRSDQYAASNPTRSLGIGRRGTILRVGAAALARRRLCPQRRSARVAGVCEIDTPGVISTGIWVRRDILRMRDPHMWVVRVREGCSGARSEGGGSGLAELADVRAGVRFRAQEWGRRV